MIEHHAMMTCDPYRPR